MTSPDAVAVAYIHGNQVAYSWHHSMHQLFVHDLGRHRRIPRGGMIAIRCPSSSYLPTARNAAVCEFLSSDVPWLWMVDTDMGFAPDTVDRLVAAADPAKRPVVGGLCLAQREAGPDGMGGWRTEPVATIYDWAGGGEDNWLRVRRDYPPDGLVACDGTGAACLLIHRDALGKVQADYGQHWFDRLDAKDGTMGEDLSFCMRLGGVGVPIHVHTGIRTTHLKAVWLGAAELPG